MDRLQASRRDIGQPRRLDGADGIHQPAELNALVRACTNGQFQAMLDQSILSPSGPVVPAKRISAMKDRTRCTRTSRFRPTRQAASLELSLDSYRRDIDPFTGQVVIFPAPGPTSEQPQLNYRTSSPNQQIRVDVLRVNSAPDYPLGHRVDSTSHAIPNAVRQPNGVATRRRSDTANLLPFAGQTIRIRIATTNNHRPPARRQI